MKDASMSLGIYFEIKDAELYGGEGTTGYAATIVEIKAFKGKGDLHGKIYQRVGKERKPIKKLKSNSIPKMIGNEEKVYGVVKPSIDRNLQHYVEQQIELLTK